MKKYRSAIKFTNCNYRLIYIKPIILLNAPNALICPVCIFYTGSAEKYKNGIFLIFSYLIRFLDQNPFAKL